MNIWYLYYDINAKRLTCRSIDANDTDDAITECNIDEFKNYKTDNKDDAEAFRDMYNSDITKELLTVHKCTKCSNYFFLSADDKAWFKEIGIPMPITCSFCRN